ncbi:MAG: hypothetical protein AB7O59_00390 [Pirellulales bacterium]
MLAVVGIGAMVAFVFLDPLMNYLGRSSGPQDPVVVETRYGDYTESQLSAIRQSRELVDIFLAQAAAATIDAQIAGGQLDPRMRERMTEGWYGQWKSQVMGRSKQGPEAAAIETLVLSKRAQDLGMVVSDRAVNDLIAQITSDSLSSDALQNIIANLNAGRRVSSARLFEAIRTEMLASNLAQMFARSLVDVPPAQKYEYFTRLNRRAKAEIVPLAVADFASQVQNPSDETLKKFFDKYRDRLPDAASPEPGFKEPRRAAFQYFKADFAKFKDEAKPKITEEEVRDYYEKNKAQFVQLDLPTGPDEAPAEGDNPAEAKPEAATPDDAQPDEPKPDAAKPSEGAAPEAESKPAEPAATTPAPVPQSSPEPPGESAPKADAAAPDAEPKQSRASRSGAFRLTSAAARLQDAAGDEAQSKETQSNESQSEAAPAETPAEPAAPAADAAAEKPAEAPPADAKPADGAPAAAVEPPAEKPAEPKYEPLEKVADQIRDSLASQKAAEKIDEIFGQLQSEMRQYADERDIYETRRETDTTAQPPQPFPFAELAKRHGVEAKELPLISATDAAAEDIGKVARIVPDRRSQFGFRQEPFVDFAFASTLPTYRANVVSDNEGNGYLFWKTEERESYVPKFEDVREKVLAAWKLIEARPLAHKRADELAAQARAANKSLKEVFDGSADLKVIETGSFSWLTGGNVPQDPSGGPVRISEIEGVAYAGPAFMEKVFGLQVGEVGVTHNVPEDTVYVVRLAEFEQTIDQLREEFAKEPAGMYLAVARPSRMQMYESWIEGLEKQADIRWVREADVAQRRAPEEAEL